MRDVDRLTTEKYGIPSILLMENAAHAVADVIKQKLGGSVKGKSFLILCGKGNNGGDGAALARILWQQGANISVWLFGKLFQLKGDALTNLKVVKKLQNINIAVPELENSSHITKSNNMNQGTFFFQEINSLEDLFNISNENSLTSDCIIDALFGTGLTRKLEEYYKETVDIFTDIRKRNSYIKLISIDVTSGLNADLNTTIGTNFNSDLTITFTAPKLANVLPPASNFNGELHIANIGSPQELIDECESQTFLAEQQDAKDWIYRTRFSSDSYKNKRGNALLIAGSRNYSGAAVLSGNAAMETGVGLVTVATSESARETDAARVLPEVIVQSLAETENGAVGERAFEKIKSLSGKADAAAIGSGLNSDEETTRNLVRKVVENRETPVIIDADGLNSLSPFDLKGSAEVPLILTPHEGEFLRLSGTKDKDVIKDRVQAVRDFATKYTVILVLKGERTLIGEPDGRVVINPTGNSGLGKAGNGDNLTGIITGFVAQAVQAETDIFNTVVAAVYIAGLAGDIAERKIGKRTMRASDVRKYLQKAFEEIELEIE